MKNLSAGRIRGILKRKKITHLPDQDGNNFPVDMVRDDLIRKHYVAMQIAEEAEKINAILKQFKDEAMELTTELWQIRKEKDDLHKRSKGGQIVYSLDKETKVTISTGSRTIFDTEIMERAEDCFNRFIQKKSGQGADADVLAILSAALKRQNGDYDPRRIANLHKVKIEDPLFKEGLALIEEARDSNRTKMYLSVEKRNPQGEYKHILLDVARV